MFHTNKEDLKPLIFTPEQKDQIITFAGNNASKIYPTHSEYPILATLKEVEFVGYESGKVGMMVRQI